MSLFYNLFIYLYAFGIRVASIFNVKARKAIQGRENWEEKLKKIDQNSSWIWMHCSSLGEFEQGRPVFEALKNKFPEYKLALSFFSPSGYEIRKNYDLADIVFYLPLDKPSNAKKLAKILKPRFWILVKYDYWFNHLKEQHEIGTKVIVISSIFRENQIYFRPSGRWMLAGLKKYINHFFVQDQESKILLEKVGINKVTIAGDTRFDRVKNIASTTEKLPWVEEFKTDKKLIVIGSSWPKDEQLWIEFLEKHPASDWKTIVVPHEIHHQNILNLKNKLGNKTIIFSDIKPETDLKQFDFLVVDAIGFLSKIYASADIGYVGGGFNSSGVHNTLEPAVFGIPIIIGPNYQKFNEVKLLKDKNILFPVSSYVDFEPIVLELIKNPHERQQIALRSKQLFENQISATEIILDYLTTIKN